MATFTFPPAGTVSVDVGALATEATLENVRIATEEVASSTADIDASTQTLVLRQPTLGQKNMAGSSPVVIASDQSAVPVSLSGVSTSAKQDAEAILVGAVTETAPASDTASSGLNGRLQRVAQRLTSLIALIPASLGQKTSAASLAVVVASDQSAVPVSAASLPLPVGAATETTLAAMSAKVPALGQAAMAASAPVVIASDQSAVPTTDGTLDTFITGAGPGVKLINSNIILPTTGTTATDMQGARSIAFQVVTAASTNIVAVNFEASNDNVNFVAVGMYDKTTPTAAPVTTFNTAASTSRFFEGPVYFRYFRVKLVAAVNAGAIQAFTILRPTPYVPTQLSLAAGTQVVGALSANQSSNVAQINGVTPLMGNGVTGTGSLRVTLASDTSSNTNALLTKVAGKPAANAPVRNDYTSTPVTTGAYVQLVASTTSACTEVEIFDSSGQTLFLATGAAASEVNQVIIYPGGNGRIPLAIASGTRVSIKAISASATVGEIDVNFYA